MRVLVTDGNSRAALAVTRSLGRAGYEVWVGERVSPCLAQASKYCAQSITYPDPSVDGPGFTENPLRRIKKSGISVLLPIADVPAALISADRELFEAHCRVPLPPASTVNRAADKADVLRTAMRLGVPVPRTWFLESADDLAALLPTLPYPVVLKSHRSRIPCNDGWQATSVGYAGSETDLVKRVEARDRRQFPLIVQERIDGPGVGAFFCMSLSDGQVRAAFSHRRLREKPPSGGVSVLCESTRLDPAMAGHAETLLQELGWRGVAMVEFKRDVRDGVAKLMEINGRFWGSLQLAVDAGVDFPVILLESLGMGVQTAMPTSYGVGIRSRWFWGDLDSLLITLFGEGDRAPQDRRLRTRLRALLEFLPLWYPGLRYENPKVRDLGPFIYESRQWFARALKIQHPTATLASQKCRR